MSRRIRLSLLVLVALLTAPVLAGCSVEGIVERVTGGNVDMGGNSVPEDFPTEIPLYDGEVLNGLTLGNETDGKVWNVSVRVPDAAALEEIATQLTDAGFQTQMQGEPTADGGTLISSNADWGVAVVLLPDEGGFVANYSVTPATAE